MLENPRKRHAAAGFSLVEMATVTLLIGIFLSMGLAAFRATQEANAVSRTQTRENGIKGALIAYIRRNDRLPCADTDFSAPDGIENRATPGDPTTACATSPGNARSASPLAASFPTSTRNLIELRNVPCRIAQDLDAKSDDGNFATGNTRASVASCAVDGANDPVALIALGL